MLLLLVFCKVLSQASQDGTANGAQQAVVCLLAKEVSADTTSDGTQQATLAVGHWRCVGVVIGCIRVARLRAELVLFDCLVELLWLAALLHACLVCLVLRVGIVGASVMLWLLLGVLLWLAVVAGVALRIAGVVGTVLAAGLAMLEATGLRRSEGVGAAGRAKGLFGIGRIGLLRVLLLVALLRAVALLRGITLVVLAVGVVGARHGDGMLMKDSDL